MYQLERTIQIQAPIDVVWRCLTNPKLMKEWGGPKVAMDMREGAEFSLWGGDIHGKNIEIAPLHKLVQEWTAGSWPSPSHVLFTLTDAHGVTELHLEHTNIPDEEGEEISIGWDTYYLTPLKQQAEELEKNEAWERVAEGLANGTRN